MAHDKPTHRDRNAIDAPQHPVKPLPDGHPLKREPMRPRGAGSEVRRADSPVGLSEMERMFGLREAYGITDENAERVLAAIYTDEDEGDAAVTPLGAALIVAACVVGVCGGMVLFAYLVVGW